MNLEFENKEDIILYLIQQELKFSQLNDALKRIRIETHIHNFTLLEVIVAIMVSSLGDSREYFKVLEGFGNIYNGCLVQAVNYPISILGNELEPLAKKTYR